MQTKAPKIADCAQNTLMDFESFPVNSTSFTSGTRSFTISSQEGGTFMVRQFSQAGWNGSVPDNRFIDNGGVLNNVPVKFTITANGSFNLKQMYLYFSNHTGVNVNSAGTVKIVGKLGVSEYLILLLILVLVLVFR